MRIKIYHGPRGTRGYLTTDSPQSHYGIPVMRVEGAAVADWPDVGPADVLGAGITAAQIACHYADGTHPDNDGGRYSRPTKAGLAAAKAFCGQWPDGPQPQSA